MIKPRLLLQLESDAFMFAAGIFYHQLHGSWLWFALLFLAPDISMFGYLANKKAGAMIYNLAHTYTIPLLLLLGLWICGQENNIWLCLIWLAHIAFDRMIGYGLKYETAFKDTHLQRV